MNEITVETQYTIHDYTDQMRFLLDRENKTGITLLIGSIFLFLFGLLFILVSYLTMRDPQFGASFGSLVSANFLIWFSVKGLTSLNKPFLLWNHTRLIKKNYDPLSIAYSKIIVKYGEKGILEQNMHGEFLTYWNAFSEVVETEADFIYFFKVSREPRFLPKRDLTQNQYLSLIELLKDKLGERAKL